MHPDKPDGSHNSVELDRLERDAIVALRRARTMRWDAAKRAMAADFDVVNAEVIALRGPDV